MIEKSMIDTKRNYGIGVVDTKMKFWPAHGYFLGFGLAAMIILGLSSCSSTQAAKTPPPDSTKPTPPQTASAPEAYDPSKLGVSKSACTVFTQVIKDVLTGHLVVQNNDATYEKTLRNGLADFLNLKGFKEDEVSAWVEKYRLSDYAECRPYLDYSKVIYENIKIRSRSKGTTAEKEAAVLSALRSGLNSTLYAIDHFSAYHSITMDKYRMAEEVWGPGLSFLSRSDYRLGRHPRYLVIKGVPAHSPNAHKRGALVNKRLLGFDQAPTGSTEGGESITIDGQTITYFPVHLFSYEDLDAYFNQTIEKTSQVLEPKALKVILEDSATSAKTLETLAFGRYTQNVAYGETFKTESGNVVGYIKLYSFVKNGSAEDVISAWHHISQGQELPALILDLRQNPGGAGDEVEKFFDTLLPERAPMIHEEIVVPSESIDAFIGRYGGMKNRQNNKDTVVVSTVLRHRVRLPSTIKPFPDNIIVLLDRFSASASEMTAGIFKDYRRGYIIGESPYGKGIGQVTRPVDKPLEGIVKYPMEYYYMPTGASFHLASDGLIHFPVKDPVVEKLFDVFDLFSARSSRDNNMATSLTVGKDVSIPKPIALNIRVSLPSDAMGVFDDARLKELAKDVDLPHSCNNVVMPNEPGFQEETDCILDVALKKADELL